jgi:thiamine kinase-like enzyme
VVPEHLHHHIVRSALHDVAPGTTWHVAPTASGQRKPAFVARSGQQAVFVKLDVTPNPLRRLEDLGVAPPLIATGTSHGHTWIVQPWLAGTHPDRAWLRTNADQVSRLLALVHGDRELSAHVPETRSIATDLAALQVRLNGALPDWFAHPRVQAALDRFTTTASRLETASPVPVHDEPNTGNMLVSADRLFLIDWDDLHRNDPFRDLGPFLWWYYPPAQWHHFLRSAQVVTPPDLRERLHWFAARASLEVTLWHAEHGAPDDRGFLTDFCAAASQAPNPRS